MREELQLETQRLKEIRDEVQQSLEKAPDGSLNISRSSGTLQYYQRLYNTKSEKRDVYLSKGNMETIQKLAQKGYDKKVLKQVEKQLAAFEKALNTLNQDSFDTPTSKQQCRAKKSPELTSIKEIYSNLGPERRQLVVAYELPDDEYGRLWEQEALEHLSDNDVHAGGLRFKTERGHYVRSKSEVIIADRLFHAGIRYVYEKSLMLQSGQSLLPDFTVLNERTRQEFIWEHFGLMDDPSYRAKTLKKINAYAKAGYVLGSGLIATFETETCPLDIETVNRYIETYLQ